MQIHYIGDVTAFVAASEANGGTATGASTILEATTETTSGSTSEATTNKQQNKNTLFRKTGYIGTGYNKLRIPYFIMQQLVRINRFINSGKIYKV